MELPDGRVLSWAELGDDSSANVLVHDHGGGSSRLELAIYDDVFADLGVRVIAPERPGYGYSTGGEQPRVVGDWPGDVACLMQRLDVPRFAVSGYSGGGPHALALAASPVLGSCVSRVLLRASLAPGQQPRYAYDGEIRKRAHRISWDEFVRWYDPSDLPDLAPADIEAFSNPTYAEGGMSTLAEGARQGSLGAVGDHWAFAGPWGFDVTMVEQPVDVWHGDADRNVPVSHAHVLDNLLPNARVRILANDGHYSIGLSVPEQASLLVDDAEA
jgi:pimeloyl-ACP methyl ester carboxylesterase